MDVLIILGSSAAFVYSCIGLWLQQPDYYFFETAASIITLVLLGNLLEDQALRGTTTAIDDLEEMEPRSARLWMGEGRVMFPRRISAKEIASWFEPERHSLSMELSLMDRGTRMSHC